MSFMSGFADSFGKQMEIGQNERAVERQDAFKIAYDSYLAKKQEFDADRKKDKQLVEQAKYITSITPNVPDGAWDYAYKLLKNGADLDAVQKRLMASTFSAVGTPAMMEGGLNNDVGPGPITDKPLNKAMTNEGLGIPTQEQPTDLMNGDSGAPQTQPGVTPITMQNALGTGGIFDKQANQARQVADTEGRIRTAVGSDYDKVMAGYTPEPHNATAQWSDTNYDALYAGKKTGGSGVTKQGDTFNLPTKNGVMTAVPDGNGGFNDVSGKAIDPNIITGPAQSQQLTTNVNQAYDDVSKLTTDLRKERSTLAGLAINLKSMDAIAQRNATAIARVSAIPNFVNEAINEVKGLQAMVDSDDQKGISGKLNEVEGWLSSKLQQVGVTAQDAQLFASQKTMITYQLARMVNGSSSTGISNKDIDNVAGAMLSTSDPVIFSNNARQMVSNFMKTSDVSAKAMLSDPEVSRVKSQFQIDTNIPQFSDLLDQDTMNWLNTNADGQPAGGAQSNQDTTQTTPPPDSTGGREMPVTEEMIKVEPSLRGVKKIIVMPDGHWEPVK